jgi:hypothetical protein
MTTTQNTKALRYTDVYPTPVQTINTDDLAAEASILEGLDELDRFQQMRYDFIREELTNR